MTDPMGTFRIDIDLENPGHRGPRRHVPGLLVDTGSELSWVPGPILESLLIERRLLDILMYWEGWSLENDQFPTA